MLQRSREVVCKSEVIERRKRSWNSQMGQGRLELSVKPVRKPVCLFLINLFSIVVWSYIRSISRYEILVIMVLPGSSCVLCM